jgi:predicted acylesterase/phospholipase RssA
MVLAVAAAAAAAAPLGFGFTGGGFLLTYFFGVIQALQESGALTATTPVAGGSAGALAALVACSGE